MRGLFKTGCINCIKRECKWNKKLFRQVLKFKKSPEDSLQGIGSKYYKKKTSSKKSKNLTMYLMN